MSILRIRDADGNVQEILTIRGEDGKDYVLTEADKQEIASMISSGMVSVVDTEAVDTHVADKNNPHNVTCEQIGAVRIDELTARVNNVLESNGVEDHLSNKDNPHGMTCEQIGAVTQAELESAVATALNNANIAYVGSVAPTSEVGKDGDIYIVSG